MSIPRPPPERLCAWAKKMRAVAERLMYAPGYPDALADARLLDDVAHYLDNRGPGLAPYEVDP